MGLASVDGLGPVAATTLGVICGGGLFTWVLLAPSGRVPDLGRTVRDAADAQRKALTARDRGCTIAGCDRV